MRDSLGSAYNRTEFVQQRREMLQAWADVLDKLRAGLNEVPTRSPEPVALVTPVSPSAMQELTAAGAAKFLKITMPFVVREIEEDRLPSRMDGPFHLVAVTDLVAYALQTRVTGVDAG